MICVDSFKQVLNESSSKGNQSKFYHEGYWIKLDNDRCYEGLAEDFVSGIESFIVNFPYVQYKSDKISYNDEIYNGCVSYNMFNRLDCSFLSLRSLLHQAGVSQNILIRSSNVSDNIMSVCQLVFDITGVDFLEYLGRLLMFDCLIINEDRHIMNLGVCYCSSTGIYCQAPCFDNGSSLFCTNWTYRKKKTLIENINSANCVARPFSKFYDKQLDALLSLGCRKLQIKAGIVDFSKSYYNSLYSDEMNSRVKFVFLNRLNWYRGRVYEFV